MTPLAIDNGVFQLIYSKRLKKQEWILSRFLVLVIYGKRKAIFTCLQILYIHEITKFLNIEKSTVQKILKALNHVEYFWLKEYF